MLGGGDKGASGAIALADAADGIAAATRYRDEVRAGTFPSAEYSFGNVKKDEARTPQTGLSLIQGARTAYGPKG